MEALSVILNAYILPCALVACGLLLAVKIRLLHILQPRNFLRALLPKKKGSGVSPAMAMCTALAGTLGVGNIAGVATAITAGGAGAVMWMWIGSAISASVKYGEVALAVKYRHREKDAFVGGTMYTARDGLSRYIGTRRAARFGAVFAALCIANSLLMGNIIQVRSAAAVFDIPALPVCAAFGAVIILLSVCKLHTLTQVTYAAIPLLSAIYIALSLAAIISYRALLPSILSEIVGEAFAVRPLVGGSIGHGMMRAVRYGITRGIFSNEAGCGTSPTAHATAETDSAHSQACFGIFEVIADTPLLCSMTAFVILLADKAGPALTDSFDGVPLALAAFETLLGSLPSLIIGISVIFFALATVATQLLYGRIAAEYLSRRRVVGLAFTALFTVCAVSASQLPSGIIWYAADIIIAVMTLMNVLMLFAMRDEIKRISSENVDESCKIAHMYCKNEGTVL